MKKVIAYFLVTLFLMTSFSMLPVSASVTIENFEAFTLNVDTQGGGNGFQRLVVLAEGFPFAVTEENELVGLYINGTATPTTGGEAFNFVDVPVTASAVRSTTEYGLDFAIQTGFDTSGSTRYTYNLTLSREKMGKVVTIENFDPFKLDVYTQGAPSGSYQRIVAKKDSLPFEASGADIFVGMYLNGTATPSTGGTAIEFNDVVITSSEFDSDSGNPKFDFANITDFDVSGATTYVYDITLSRTAQGTTGGGDDGDSEITIENFEPFTLDIYTQGGGSGFQRFLIKKDCVPFEVTSTTSFVGFYLNGTATDGNGSVFNFVNVQVSASDVQRTDNYYAIDFPIQSGFETVNHTYNITLSREALSTGGEEITIENFEPFKLDVYTQGAPSGSYQRIVAKKDSLPFEASGADIFVGMYLNGTATPSTGGTAIEFNDVVITSSEFDSDSGNPKFDFANVTDFDTTGATTYVYDITLSRTAQGTAGGGDDGGGDDEGTDTEVFDPYNFTPFKLTVTADGADGLKRLVVSASSFPIPLTENNQIVGCLLNGTATPTASGIANGYTETITFTDVMVEKSTIRDGATAYNVEFTTLEGLPTTGGYFTFDLTLSPKPEPTVDFPSDSSTFFIHPDQFSCTGNWKTETDSGKYVLFGTGSILGTASALVVIPEDGTYTVKGYARDYLNDSETYRYMDIEINGVKGNRIGAHATEGFKWETIGTYELKKGDEVLVEVVKAGLYARLAAVCFSTATDYTPSDAHMEENFNKASAKLAFLPLDETKINMLLLPEDFDTDLGTWTETTDGTYDILSGITSGTAKEATASINVQTGGIYYIWGYSKDNSAEDAQGTAKMKIGVNGTVLDGDIGVFGATEETDEGGSYGWDYAGKVWVAKGTSPMVSVIDTSVNGAKLAAVMITSDANFKGISEKNFPTYAENSAFRASVNKEIIDISGINSYGNKLSFTLKNRTANPIENGVLIYSVYTKAGRLADVSYQTFEDLDAYSGLEKTEHIFSSTESWTKGKIMLWDGITTMKPLVEVQNFNFSEEDYTNPDENAGGDFGTVTDYDVDYLFRNETYEAKEFNERGGLKNTIAKLQKGEDVTVAYLGGSITEGETWRPLTTAWMKQTYPDANITEVEIGMSGTGADLAATRIGQDILVHNPDLVFIEYAANGGEEKDAEGLALQVWKHDPTTDIIFVYVSQTYNFGIYQSGSMPEIPQSFENIANHYDIPSVFFVYHPLDLYENDELTLTGKEEGKVLYTTDTIHMTKDGGYLAASAIARLIKKQEESLDINTYQITNHAIPEDYYQPSPYYPWSEATYTDDWTKMKFTGTWLDCSRDASGNLQNYTYTGGNEEFDLFDKMTGTKTPGSSITIKFKGTDIGIFEAGGQYSGQVKVTIDGVEQSKSWQLFDTTYDSKLRYQYNFYESLPYGEHTVTFTLDSTMPDKSGLQSKYPSDSMYELNELYIGRILLNGVLLDANE